MEKALVALVGVLIGILLNEHFRKKSRIETYSQRIFDKRLEVYEGLMVLIQESYNVANEVIENSELSKEDRHAIISGTIAPIAKYTDDNALYLDSYIGAQATALLMGVEDIQDIEDSLEKEAEISRFRADYKATKEIIIADSGVAEVNKHFKAISKSNPNTPIIEYIKKQEKNKT